MVTRLTRHSFNPFSTYVPAKKVTLICGIHCDIVTPTFVFVTLIQLLFFLVYTRFHHVHWWCSKHQQLLKLDQTFSFIKWDQCDPGHYIHIHSHTISYTYICSILFAQEAEKTELQYKCVNLVLICQSYAETHGCIL